MEDRRVRFLVPPFILLFALLDGVAVGLYEPFGEFLGKTTNKDSNIAVIIGLLAAGGVGVFAFGLIIGSISITILRCRLPRLLRFIPWPKFFGPDYEVGYADDATIKIIMNAIGAKKKEVPVRRLYPGAIYDHGWLYRKAHGLHQWLARRWNIFNLLFHSGVALCMSFLFGSIQQGFYLLNQWRGLDLNVVVWWWLPHLILIPLLFLRAYRAYEETMGMATFISTELEETSDIFVRGE